ncbi:MAG: purine-binding chemotaxis protein CheW [Rhodobacteraceae bacterium]|nr:purine-binding chemotaxis protein CheW [Paracoccaceae bacterium]
MSLAQRTKTDDLQSANTAEQIELLTFHAGQQEYAVDIMSVREIRGWTKTTSLPHAPSFVHGVINLRGTVLPVIDLARRLEISDEPPQDRDAIIVVDAIGRTVGLRVDSVSDILTLPSDELRLPPEIAGTDAQDFLSAITLIDERMVRVLDLSSVMPEDEQIS